MTEIGAGVAMIFGPENKAAREKDTCCQQQTKKSKL